MTHTQDRGQNAPQPTSAGQGLLETAGQGSAVTEQRTPGPWFAVWNDHYFEISTADDRFAPSLGAVWARVPGLQVGAEADARLIAAAPEMLAALSAASHALMSYAYGNGSPDLAKSTAEHIDELIAKAGPQP